MYIGCDIIDLNYEKRFPHHPRFAQRVLTQGEYCFYRQQGAFLYLAKCWAAKEAVYKLLRQSNDVESFHPSDFNYCDLTATLNFREFAFKVHFVCDGNFLYGYVSHGEWQKVLHGIGKVSDLMEDCLIENDFALSLLQKSAVRRLAKKMIAEAIPVDSGKISFNKSISGVPQALYQGKKMDVSLSFSHHGEFCSVTALMP